MDVAEENYDMRMNDPSIFHSIDFPSDCDQVLEEKGTAYAFLERITAF